MDFVCLRRENGAFEYMSSEEVFVQQFAKLFVHYRDALTLDSVGEHGNGLHELNEVPVVELDRMISAARLAVLEIETNARERDDARHYYSGSDRTIGQIR
jgi:hypothetical protein